MSEHATIEGGNHIPGRPALVIPNRMNAAALLALEEQLGGSAKVAWMIEQHLRPDEEVVNLLLKRDATGFTIPPQRLGTEPLLKCISAMHAAGRHVVLLPGRPAQPPAAPADTTPELLRYLLADYAQPILPVYVGMYSMKKAPFVTTEPPCDRTLVSICPLQMPGEAAVAGVQAAWYEAGAAQVAALAPQLYGGAATAAQPAAEPAARTLAHALLSSLLAHPDALILDGVDNKQMSYGQLLTQATMLARQLRMHVSSKRIGIILPPGKYAVIANVACLLAGIVPVNIDYHYNRATFEEVTGRAKLDRIITENRFVEMQVDFPWPLKRDILFIDELPQGDRYGIPFHWRILRRAITPARLAKWIRTPGDADPLGEALAVFPAAAEGVQLRGTVLSHSAVLAGAALTYSRLGLRAGSRVLSALPFYHHAGLLQGLIYPLLMGQDIITYSLPDAGKRLGELARRHSAELAIFTPRQAAGVLAAAAEGDFQTTRYFFAAGKITEAEARMAYERHHLRLCEYYMPQECAMPIACNLPDPDPTAAAPHRPALPCGAAGTVGLPMPGVALRITDLDDPLKLQPLHAQGLVWVKGAGIVTDPAGSRSETPRPPHDRWFCTGEVGRLQENGLLVVHGPRSRFSQIEGRIIFHGEVEQLMAKYLKADVSPGAPPSIAIIGVQDETSGADKLVLLSALPNARDPHALLTLYYALSNEHRFTGMTPGKIVPVRAIPTLPSGRVNYELCHHIYRLSLNKR